MHSLQNLRIGFNAAQEGIARAAKHLANRAALVTMVNDKRGLDCADGTPPALSGRARPPMGGFAVMRWSKFTPAELERRRLASVDAMAARDRDDFRRRYQESCDRLYWSNGPCCAGCDHWRSARAMTGECGAAGVVSGDDVMRSMGIEWSSLRFSPGFPFTEATFHCGKFRDDFDWSSLAPDYLSRIGAKLDVPHD